MLNANLFFLDNPTMETDRLILRKISLADEEEIFSYASIPEVSKYVSWECHETIEDTREFINLTLERYSKDEAGEWALVLKNTNRIIGIAGFVQYRKEHKSIEVGYVLARDYWRQGFAAEAVQRLIRFAFTEMSLNRVEAVHFPDNEASGRVMQKVGMTYEGLMREKVFIKGHFQDLKQYAIIKKDWQTKF